MDKKGRKGKKKRTDFYHLALVALEEAGHPLEKNVIKEVIIKNYEGKIFRYPQPTKKSAPKEALSNEESVATKDICQMPA